MSEPLYTQSHFRPNPSNFNPSLPLKPNIYPHYPSQVFSDSETTSPHGFQQISKPSHSRNSFFSTLVKTESTASSFFPVNSRGTIDTPKDHEFLFNHDPTPRGINNFNEEDMDEFSNSPGKRLASRHNSSKIPSSSLLKKSMSDVVTKGTRNKSISYTPQTVTKNGNKNGKEGSLKEFENAVGRMRAETGGKKSFFREEKSLKLKISSPVQKNERGFQDDLGLLNYTDNFGGIERSQRSLKDFFILSKVLMFLDFADTWRLSKLCYCFRNVPAYKKAFLKRFYHHFSNGLTHKEQLWFWNTVVPFRHLRNFHPFAYTQHFAKKCSYLLEIKKDIDRTLPEYSKFSTQEGKAGLLRVLMAISNTIKDMGYIQGLNSIAGIFLFYLREEESFWILMYFMEKLKYKDLLREDFNKIHLLNFQLKIYLEYYLPEIPKRFKGKEMGIPYITTPWFLTLFSYNLRIPNVVKIWNFLFTKGLSFLIQFTLAIFFKYKDAILKMDIEEAALYLKHEIRNLSDEERLLFKNALSIKVSNKMLREMETHFMSGKQNLQLTVGQKGKLQLSDGLNQNSEIIYNPKIIVQKVSPSKQALNYVVNPLQIQTSSASSLYASPFIPKDSTSKQLYDPRFNTPVQIKKNESNFSIDDDLGRPSSPMQTLEDYRPSSGMATPLRLDGFQQPDFLRYQPSLLSFPSSDNYKNQRSYASLQGDPSISNPQLTNYSRELTDSRTDLFAPMLTNGGNKMEKFHQRTHTTTISTSSFQALTNPNEFNFVKYPGTVEKAQPNHYFGKYGKSNPYEMSVSTNTSPLYKPKESATAIYEPKDLKYFHENLRKMN